MELLELMAKINEHNKTGRGFQIHLNSGNLDEKSNRNTGVEFNDMYFTECSMLKSSTLLCFSNLNKLPTYKSDGVAIYPLETNSSLFIDINKIEVIEQVENPDDWYELPSEKIINLYMLPEDSPFTGHRNVVSIGFMG
ncbi:MAG: hypothetical protein SOY73_14960 [Blautia sp.]|nr:hypothetical protein [Blautia sp.]